MRKTFSFFIFIVLNLSFLNLSFSPIAAIYDPLSVTNNRIGVHILSPDELDEANKLVNNNSNASWGYVTVPIQSGDRDRVKWTRFMNKAYELKIIPLIRVATFASDKNWTKPGNDDLIDFANFLNELPWPTKNRYVIIFNEVNRPDEYGGAVSPEEYADILNNAIDIFKSRSDKFFILPSALDNAAPNKNGYIRYDVYLERMYKEKPEIFNRLDGWTSHAYGNPDFRSSPVLSGDNKADSFKYDLKILNKYTKKKLPVFITEAGWANVVPSLSVANFYNYAFTHVWSNDQVVAVTPFLLHAGAPPFDRFSLLGKNFETTPAYDAIKSFATHGAPFTEDRPTPTVSPTETLVIVPTSPPRASPANGGEGGAPEGVLSETITVKPSFFDLIKNFFSNLLAKPVNNKEVLVGDKKYQVEVVTSIADQATGLAKYDSLDADKGMLFIFNNTKQRFFWMKNMKFDIDIVWIKNKKVVGITSGLYKNQFKMLPSNEAVDAVLEVNPASGIQIGDSVSYWQ